jgi:hypothetical protein
MDMDADHVDMLDIPPVEEDGTIDMEIDTMDSHMDLDTMDVIEVVTEEDIAAKLYHNRNNNKYIIDIRSI